jgi:hypothetical protein
MIERREKLKRWRLSTNAVVKKSLKIGSKENGRERICKRGWRLKNNDERI